MNQKAVSKKPVYVGVDDGHYAVKVVTEDGKYYTIPSRAKAGKHVTQLQGASDAADGGIYKTAEGHTYTVNEHLSDCDDTRISKFPLSELNRVLVHHGLRNAGFAGVAVNIATGLPISHYYSGPEVNSDLISGKVANLKQLVTCDSGECAIIEGNVVTTEAIAAYFDQLMDMDGQPTAVYEEVKDVSVGVIDGDIARGLDITDHVQLLRGRACADAYVHGIESRAQHQAVALVHHGIGPNGRSIG